MTSADWAENYAGFQIPIDREPANGTCLRFAARAVPAEAIGVIGSFMAKGPHSGVQLLLPPSAAPSGQRAFRRFGVRPPRRPNLPPSRAPPLGHSRWSPGNRGSADRHVPGLDR